MLRKVHEQMGRKSLGFAWRFDGRMFHNTQGFFGP